MATRRLCDAVLVTMPFAPVTQPSLALSLLRGMLAPGRAAIHYETLRFADEIGVDLYDRVVDGVGAPVSLAGEWLFAEAAFGADASRDQTYIDQLLLRESLDDDEASVERALLDDLLAARERVDAYLAGALERVLDAEPLVVGFTSVFQQHVASLALAKRIKAAQPATVVVFGGANCEGSMGEAMLRHFEWVDAVVSGEGELPFRDLVDQVEGGRSIDRVAGVTTRSHLGPLSIMNAPRPVAAEIAMDDLPVPDYDDFFEQWEVSSVSTSRTPYLLFESARGCWWGALRHCTFCGLNGDRMRFRSKSSERAVTELRELTAARPGLPVYAVDNIIDRDYFATVLPAIAEQPTDAAAIFYEVKANLTKEQLVLLRDAGVRDIQPGIESLHDSVLRLMRKGVTALGNIQLLKWCQELGLRPHWNILWGFPHEPADAYTDMAAMIPNLVHLRPPTGTGRIRLDRFSPNFDDAAELGLVNVRPAPAYRLIYGLDDAALHELAYFFDFDSADAPDHGAEADQLRHAIADWQRQHVRAGLWSLDDGEQLTVWDFRRDTSTATRLEGLERALLIALDACRSVRELTTIVGRSADEVSAALEPMRRSGLIVTDGRRHLALPVWLGDRSLPGPFLARMMSDVVASLTFRPA